jgi:hypothetical protein
MYEGLTSSATQFSCDCCYDLNRELWPGDLKFGIDDAEGTNAGEFEGWELGEIKPAYERATTFEHVSDSAQRGCQACSIICRGILTYNGMIGGSSDSKDISAVTLHFESPFKVAVQIGGNQFRCLEFYTLSGI